MRTEIFDFEKKKVVCTETRYIGKNKRIRRVIKEIQYPVFLKEKENEEGKTNS